MAPALLVVSRFSAQMRGCRAPQIKEEQALPTFYTASGTKIGQAPQPISATMVRWLLDVFAP